MSDTVNKCIIKSLEQNLPRLDIPKDLQEWKKRDRRVRKDFLKLFFEGHPEGVLDADFKVEYSDVIQKEGYRIRKLRYEGYPGLWVPAALYEPENIDGKVPGVLNANGHHVGGKAMAYKQARCINLAKQGVMALNYEFLGMGQLSSLYIHNQIALLDLCGVSGIGVFYLAMKRALDVLAAHKDIDPEKIAMTGLSGGGWQTIILSSLDKRITYIIPVAGHSAIWQRKDFVCDIGDMEQCPRDFCTVADYDTLSAMCAPRPTLFIYNRNDDCCFRPERTRVSIFFPTEKVYSLYDKKHLVDFYVNKEPGTHNYASDNRVQLYRFLNKHMNLDLLQQDLPYEDELLTEQELSTELPANNETFQSLARKELIKIRRQRKSQTKRQPIKMLRKRLAEIIRLPEYHVSKEKTVKKSKKKAGVSRFQLCLNDIWKLPVTIVRGKGSGSVELRISLDGIPGEAELKELGEDGQTRIFADILNTGELSCSFQYHMLISASGQRSLGIQVAQILALAEWIRKRYKASRIKLQPGGFMQGLNLAGLIAAALQPEAFEEVQSNWRLRSLDMLIDLPMEYNNEKAPLFCFGLLREFDIDDLIEMSETVRLTTSVHGPLK